MGFLVLLVFLRSCNPNEIKNDQEYMVSQEIIFEVVIPKTKMSINAAQVDLRFDEKRLALTKIEENKKFFVYQIEKDYDNSLGWSRMSGGLPHPGIKESNLVLVKFYFQARQSGNAYISYSPTSLVLADDGVASEAYKLTGEKWYRIINPL